MKSLTNNKNVDYQITAQMDKVVFRTVKETINIFEVLSLIPKDMLDQPVTTTT